MFGQYVGGFQVALFLFDGIENKARMSHEIAEEASKSSCRMRGAAGMRFDIA